MDWFGVRSVYRNQGSEELADAYEERIVLFQAEDFPGALVQAEAEAFEYAGLLGYEVLSCFQAYCLPEEPATGAEVFSLIRRSRLEPEAYVDHFFDTGEELQGQAE
jgi:hypothetical protein